MGGQQGCIVSGYQTDRRDYAVRPSFNFEGKAKRSAQRPSFDAADMTFRTVAQLRSGIVERESTLLSIFGEGHRHGGISSRNPNLCQASLDRLCPGDERLPRSDNANMETSPVKDWYLKEWLVAAKKKRVDLIRDLGWSKAKASDVWNGKSAYRRELVNEISEWLGIEPHELLMSPRDAQALRALRETARHIVGV